MNGNDIVANLRAAIERELTREDWPHRILEAHLKIVNLHPAYDDGEGDLLCQKCRYADHELYAERCYPCPTLLALAEAHEIAVAGPGDDPGRPPL